MNHNGNQKHLTFEQRVDIEKGFTENKSFAEIARIIGKDPSTVSKEVRLHAHTAECPNAGYTNPPCIHRKTCKIVCLCDDNAELSAKSVGSLIGNVSMYAPDLRPPSVKNWRSLHMSAMVAAKRHTALCQGSFIHPNMPMMSIVASWLTAELVLIRLRKVFSQ